MRTRTSIVRGFVLAVALPAVVALSGMQSGCSSPQKMRSASGVPASEGTVDATVGDNGNTNLAVRVKHLAAPSRMASEATVYVVWVQPPNANMQNVGALTLNDNLEGSLDTVTPQSRFWLSVTPEASGTAERPTHTAVFTAEVDVSQSK